MLHSLIIPLAKAKIFRIFVPDLEPKQKSSLKLIQSNGITTSDGMLKFFFKNT
jgi:hypothetical protein